jgi:hypothetical protein
MAAGGGAEQAVVGHGNGLEGLEYLDFLYGTLAIAWPQGALGEEDS